MKKITGILILLLCFYAVFAAGCADNDGSAVKTSAETEEKISSDDVRPSQPEFVNPLTGLEADSDISNVRPVAIMVNNIHASLPQMGIGSADIMYECLAEGGITRLMMITTEYEKLSRVGSVRSARDYYIDFAESYNSIFVHAGASDYAYNTLSQRESDHLDGVRGSSDLFYKTGTFERDPERLKSFSYEHTLTVKSGEGLREGIKYAGIETEKAAGYEYPVNFAPWGKKTELDKPAEHVNIVMSSYQTVDYVCRDGKYYRFQYGGEPHMDADTNEQLCFDNVVIMFSDTGAISGDDKGRIQMQTTGEGSGWLITAGTCKEIKWQKKEHDSPVKYYFDDKTEAELNRGKTAVNVVPSYSTDGVTFDSDTSLMK